MSARIVEGIFTCTKRWALENALENVRTFNAKRARKMRLPMCGIEYVLRILTWVDSLDDPSGRLYGQTPHSIELAAQWDGPPGALVKALIETGWIDETPDGMRWHDYWRMNGIAIADRVKKRRKRGDTSPHPTGDGRGDSKGDKTGDSTGDTSGASGSGSGSGGLLRESPPQRADDAAAGPMGPPPRVAAADSSQPAPISFAPPIPNAIRGPVRRSIR